MTKKEEKKILFTTNTEAIMINVNKLEYVRLNRRFLRGFGMFVYKHENEYERSITVENPESFIKTVITTLKKHVNTGEEE
jgi:hypothetical protein